MMDIRKWFCQGTTAASDQSGREGEKQVTEAKAAGPTLITEAEAAEPSSKGTRETVLPPGDIGDNHSEEGPTTAETEPSSSTAKILQAPTPPLPLQVPDDLGDEEPAQFLRKPTVAAKYMGEKLKRLLEQRWTGHLDTVSVIMKSLDSIIHLLREIESTCTYGTEM
ncbi:hypothetical protein EOD39_2936 [Acipenser ruthenus]|uniref:Uncharacterized protein n=1 Tax=Acipenser ruthenus TaxID=7906 RepID=A0A444TX93_ACIRT|nr:hypothetical protein EOD39_2936 [Acipenser ruthenus]